MFRILVTFFLLSVSAFADTPFNCVTQAAGTPTIRVRGVTEKTGDLLLICVGGTFGTPREFDVTVSLSLPVTNPAAAPNKTDALLFVDEPTRANQVAGQNVFLGELDPPTAGGSASQTVRFRGVKTSEAGLGTTRILRITNLRVNASAGPNNPQATIPVYATVTSSPLIAGLPATSITATRSVLPMIAYPGPTPYFGYQMQVRVEEATPAEFRKRSITNPDQEPLGLTNYAESGYVSTLFQSAGVPTTGQANSGTRVVINFTNVPLEQQVFVSTRPVGVTNLSFDLRLTATADAGGAEAFSEMAPTSNTPSPGIAPVTITNGQGMAVYEVIDADPLVNDTATIGIVLQGGSRTPNVRASFGPLTSSPQAWVPRFAVSQPGPGNIPVAVFRDQFSRILLLEFSGAIFDAGGIFVGKPGAAQDTNGDTWIVGRDTSDGLYITRFRAATKLFDDWIFLGGKAKGDPSVSVTPAGNVFYTIRDASDSCWMGVFRPGIGNSWHHLGGIVATDPQITAVGDQMWVAAKDTWGGTWTVTVPEAFGATTALPWTFRGGIIQGQPSLSNSGG